jgi:hypothetical protein
MLWCLAVSELAKEVFVRLNFLQFGFGPTHIPTRGIFAGWFGS